MNQDTADTNVHSGAQEALETDGAQPLPEEETADRAFDESEAVNDAQPAEAPEIEELPEAAAEDTDSQGEPADSEAGSGEEAQSQTGSGEEAQSQTGSGEEAQSQNGSGDTTGAESSGGEKSPSLEERLAALEERIERQAAEAEAREKDRSLRQHFGSLRQQGAELKKQLPDFNLDRELEDPEFFRLTSPEVGLGVEAAFYALHHADLQAQAYERAARAVSESVRAGAYLPRENGAAPIGTPPSAPRSYRDMSPEERLARKQLIMSGHRF